MRVILGGILILIGFFAMGFMGVYLLVVGIIDIVHGGSIFWNLVLIFVRDIVAFIVGIVAIVLGLGIAGSGD